MTANRSRPTPAGPDLPEGTWGLEESQAILDKTLTVGLDPDLEHLTPAERGAVGDLLAAGAVFERLYQHQRHHQALEAHRRLAELDAGNGSSATRSLRQLYRLFKGPIATTLDNQRQPFLAVDGEVPGKNVYPLDLERDELDDFLEHHPEAAGELLQPRGVVRRASAESLDRDLAVLAARPELGVLHPGLEERLRSFHQQASGGLYGVPYSVAYSDELGVIYRHLWRAAERLAGEDRDFAAYLRHRARDLLSDDYEAGDAAWISGEFTHLNAQIGCYETYDDELAGVKCFMSLSLLARDRARSDALAAAVTGIQEIEDRLPYDRPKRVRSDIPVGVYRVIADFGQARGANTATILPNEADLARKYGRVILMRHNLITHPELFDLVRLRFTTAVDPAHHGDLTLEAGFERTLWHEVGHYLGPDRTDDDRELDVALSHYASLIEELKADLVSLFAARSLETLGTYTAAERRAVYASGVLRVLQTVRPRREQPYQTMQLMQLNYYLEHGLLAFDADSGRLGIDYGRYHEVVTGLLREVLAVQCSGDPQAAQELVERWGDWRSDLHEVVAERLRAAMHTRYVLVEYAALGDGLG